MSKHRYVIRLGELYWAGFGWRSIDQAMYFGVFADAWDTCQLILDRLGEEAANSDPYIQAIPARKPDR